MLRFRALTLPLLFMLLSGPVADAAAQRFGLRGGPQPVQSLSFGYYLIDFEFDGDAEPLFSLDFDEPLYGVVYTRPNVLISLGYGTQPARAAQEELSMFDVSLGTWGAFYPEVLSAARTRALIPIQLFSNYRRVVPREGGALTDGFNVTVLGLGAGLGIEHAASDRALLEARLNPILGFASSSFTDGLGSARLLEADLQAHLLELFGRAGLTLGYNFRLQRWNVNASQLFPDETDDLFDYRGQQHLFRAGINF